MVVPRNPLTCSRIRASFVVVFSLSVAVPSGFAFEPTSQPAVVEAPIRVPKLWDPKELADWATPVAGLGVAPSFISDKEYYALPVDNLMTYPVYHPRREPPGYREELVRKGPRLLIDARKLRTMADWVEAGRRVFDEWDDAESRTTDPKAFAYLRDDRAVDEKLKAGKEVMTRDGILPVYRWLVDRDGVLKLSFWNCGECHSRLMPDGTLLRGAPSNFDSDTPVTSALFDQLAPRPRLSEGENFYMEYGVPWRQDDIHARFRKLPDDEVLAFLDEDTGAPTGATFPRFNGSPFFTTRMADLIGVQDRRYLDATATHANRGTTDIARYCILVEGADHGVFGRYKMVPAANLAKRVSRPPDETIYALALFLESLSPPPNPHPFNDLARRGQMVFEAEGCNECHTPPVYTNNKLVAVPGFDPPKNDPATARLNISTRRVGTDPGAAVRTRKGTGYYKIPSLRGLWYRGLYEHSGSVSSLEDWFDPRRLREDYVPTGWRGHGVKTRSLPGHKFGLDLSPDEKRALIAFLKTL